MNDTVLFRAACNPSIGIGHLQRCLTLAIELRERGFSVFVVTDENQLAKQIASRYGGLVEYVSPSMLLPKTIDMFRVLVLDTPPYPESFLETRPSLSQLSTLNDAGVSIVSLGHVVQNALYLRSVIDLYPYRQIHSANYLEGSEYLILRREFEEDPPQVSNGNVVLISMGGSDPLDLTRTALKAVEKSGFSGLVQVILGAGYPEQRENELREWIKHFDFEVCFQRNVEDMCALMRQASLGITAFGTTAYEMMSQCLPVMAFTHYHWQEPSARLFEELECCKYLGCAEDPIDQSALGEMIKKLISDKDRLYNMAKKGRSTVDGKGTRRVADLLEQMLNEKDGLQLDVLFVLAHPGDELFGCGGTLLKHIEAGDRVGLVILGEGVSSRSREVDGKEIIIAARQEIRSSLQAVIDNLDLKTWYYYRFEDNRFDKHDLLDLIKVIETIISRHCPHTIYTHHSGDLNIDHRRTFEAVITAVRPSAHQPVSRVFSVEVPSSSDWGGLLQKDVFSPNWFVDISHVLERKVELIRHYVSELRDDPHPRSIPGIQERARQWGRVAGRPAAEAFVLQRAIHD